MKIYREKAKQELKKPQIRFIEKYMHLVDENGNWIATAIDFKDCTFSPNTKSCLEKKGYSTDWAEWDDYGRMTELLEDFE